MRIIRGKYKGRHVPAPTGFKARPTTDFAKEGLFNILENVYVDFDEAPTALDLLGYSVPETWRGRPALVGE